MIEGTAVGKPDSTINLIIVHLVIVISNGEENSDDLMECSWTGLQKYNWQSTSPKAWFFIVITKSPRCSVVGRIYLKANFVVECFLPVYFWSFTMHKYLVERQTTRTQESFLRE